MSGLISSMRCDEFQRRIGTAAGDLMPGLDQTGTYFDRALLRFIDDEYSSHINLLSKDHTCGPKWTGGSAADSSPLEWNTFSP